MNYKLNNPIFRTFSIQEIKPTGWLRRQLEIQADGLSGHLDEFWLDIQYSGWIGGKGEDCERMPYWLDGFVPLAFLLEREDLIARAKTYIDEIISRQQLDGWITPTPSDKANCDSHTWSAFLMLKVLVVWHDATGDSRIEEVISRALRRIDRLIGGYLLAGWAQSRWFEALISIFWLYERTQEQWLLELAIKIHSQGFDWKSFFQYWPLAKLNDADHWSHMSHVVNNAMMLKSSALWWRITGDETDIKSIYDRVALLDEHHGLVTGMFSGDECLAGNSPVQGTELCSVVEYMYSLQHIIAITGDPSWGDRLERIAYNALPATFSPDMWTHQYDQQVNQMECSRDVVVYLTNDNDSNLFGLEPNYGCCTANLSQAWPKLVSSICMRSDDGIVVTAWAPVIIKTRIDDVPVTIEIITDYPFKNTAKIVVTTESQISFALKLRIPEWADGASVSGVDVKVNPVPGQYCTVLHEWKGETIINVDFPMKPMIVSRPNSLYAVTRGPLVYSLRIGEEWKQINMDVPGRELPHGDYEVYATTPWNYGLCLDINDPKTTLLFEEKDISDMPFSPHGAPVICHVSGKQVEWNKEKGTAAPTPSGGVIGETEELIMIPYGCTNLRMTEMPIVK